jgi:hypothetical protein
VRYEHPATDTSAEPTHDDEELIEDDSDSDYHGGKRRKHHVFNVEPTNDVVYDEVWTETNEAKTRLSST